MNAPLALSSQIGTALAHEIRQEDHALAALAHLARRVLKQFVRVAAREPRGLRLGVAELLAIPGNGGAGGDRAAEHVVVLQAVEHVRHADEAVARVHRPADVAPTHAGADHRDVLAAPGRPRGEGGDGRIDAARDDRRAGEQTELR